LDLEQISPEHKVLRGLKELRVVKEPKVVVSQLYMGHSIMLGLF
jgi:hypothetical protein